ncbi:Bis(5'-nucleosyl)-tetraphosphatase PrpE [asymmetrical] [Gammaproteobacteria bacterium]|nr:Bis(5'-nucleosyl)-tetraphosphatase PrpE [asymmetrical] [Gammaproteobacteria bacterium]
MPGDHLFQPLFDGPLDIVGDIYGEPDALGNLLAALGYDADGRHPGGRRLVFIGDLCDRGPDSPAVFARVAGLVERGLAQCLLGNHELNVLRNARKEGNGWFFPDDHDAAHGRFAGSSRASDTDRSAIRRFITGLPVVLERADLRLVHAAWDDAALALLRECRAATLAIYNAYSERTQAVVQESGIGERAGAQWREYREQLTDPQVAPPLLESLGRLDTLEQMANPLRIATSGPETLASKPFFAAGKWRMVDRVRWWDHYRHEVPVIVGHYWHWPTAELRAALTRGEQDLFDGAGIDQWLGMRRNVYCVDFGVGARYKERAAGVARFATRLGALRWPEREVVTDDGGRIRLR